MQAKNQTNKVLADNEAQVYELRHMYNLRDGVFHEDQDVAVDLSTMLEVDCGGTIVKVPAHRVLHTV